MTIHPKPGTARLRDLPRFAESADRNVNQSPLLLFIGVEVAHQQVGAQRPQGKRVDSDVFAARG